MKVTFVAANHLQNVSKHLVETYHYRFKRMRNLTFLRAPPKWQGMLEHVSYMFLKM